MPQARVMAAYIRDGYGAYRQPKFECACYEMLVFRVCGTRQNLYVYSLYTIQQSIQYSLYTTLTKVTGFLIVC